VLADQLLGRKLRGTTVSDVTGGQQLPHDSVEDAAASMALVQEELRRLTSGQGPTPPLQPPEVKVGGWVGCSMNILSGIWRYLL